MIERFTPIQGPRQRDKEPSASGFGVITGPADLGRVSAVPLRNPAAAAPIVLHASLVAAETVPVPAPARPLCASCVFIRCRELRGTAGVRVQEENAADV